MSDFNNLKTYLRGSLEHGLWRDRGCWSVFCNTWRLSLETGCNARETEFCKQIKTLMPKTSCSWSYRIKYERSKEFLQTATCQPGKSTLSLTDLHFIMLLFTKGNGGTKGKNCNYLSKFQKKSFWALNNVFIAAQGKAAVVERFNCSEF